MWVYIITFEGAYGMQIEAVYTCRKKAEEHIAKMNDNYTYEITETFAY